MRQIYKAYQKVYFKIAVFSASFVALAAFTAVLCNFQWNNGSDQQRESEHQLNRVPASDEYDENGDIMFSHETIQDLEAEGRRSFGGVRAPRHRDGNVFDHALSISAADASRISGSNAIRARRATFDQGVFIRSVKTTARKVKLNLFDNYTVVAELRVPSVYSQNQGIYTGTIDGDPSGQVRLFVEGSKINGTIEAAGHSIRILEAGDGTHLIIEEDNKRL
jgi:hypothetical protein